MSFLTLPVELREQIIELVVFPEASDGRVYIDPRIQHPFQASPSAVQHPITFVNKQCRAEAIPIFYKTITFVIALLNESSVRLCQRWFEAVKNDFHLMKQVWLKVYPSFDGRSLTYDEFRWHAHGPYWLRLHIRERDVVAVAGMRSASEIPYLLGVTEVAGTLAPLWSTKEDGWLLVTVDMILAALGKRLHEQELRLSVDCV